MDNWTCNSCGWVNTPKGYNRRNPENCNNCKQSKDAPLKNVAYACIDPEYDSDRTGPSGRYGASGNVTAMTRRPYNKRVEACQLNNDGTPWIG